MVEKLSVSWDEYQKNMCKGLGALQQRGEFVDMTLAAEGHHVKVHQMVLSLVSPFIKELITSANCLHPVIFLNRVSYETMQAILEYAYTGEVIVEKDKIGEFLQACKDLHIRGLENMLNNVRTTVDDSNESNSRKRKKPSDEETHEDTAQNFEDDDFFQTDVTDDEEPLKRLLPDNIEVERDTVESVNETSENILKKSASLQYSVSIHNNLQIMLHRYLYSYIRNRKNSQRYWRCINQQKSGCLAYVTTLEDQVVERGHPHNHTFHDAQILKRIKNGNMFTCFKEVEKSAAIMKKKRDERPDLLIRALKTIE